MDILGGNLLGAIASVLSLVLTLYFWIVIISAVLSWVNPDPYNPIVRTLRNLTEPVFYRIRRTFPFVVISGIDLSPIVVILGIHFLERFVVASLASFAMRM